MGKQQCSASALPSVTERLDSRCCWQRFYSETAPPCRLCGGSPVCWVGALPPARNVARGILHTTALLFGCHLRTICIWPHSNSAWARRLWRFYLHGLYFCAFMLVIFFFKRGLIAFLHFFLCWNKSSFPRLKGPLQRRQWAKTTLTEVFTHCAPVPFSSFIQADCVCVCVCVWAVLCFSLQHRQSHSGTATHLGQSETAQTVHTSTHTLQ